MRVMGRSGQNIVEYILLVTVVVTVFLIFLRRQGPMENSLHKTLGTVDTSIKSLDAEIGFDGATPKPIHSK